MFYRNVARLFCTISSGGDKQGILHFSDVKATVTLRKKKITVMETAVPTLMVRKTPQQCF